MRLAPAGCYVQRKFRAIPKTLREWLLTAIFGVLAVGLSVYCWAHLPLVDFLPYKKGVDLREAVYGDPGGKEDDILLREFAIFGPEGDMTAEVLNHPGRVYILCAASLEDISPECEKKFAEVVKSAIKTPSGALTKVILVTSSYLEDTTAIGFDDAPPVPVYNMGSSTMITLLRARTGLVVIEDGVIVDKKNCRDLP